MRKIALAGLCLAAAPAQAQAIATRWELRMYGRDTIETGDLRLEGAASRLLLQHADSAFQPLQRLRIVDGRISFALASGGRSFEGTVSDTLLSGTVRAADGVTAAWTAIPLNHDLLHWPVPPRVLVRQLATGSVASVERIPLAWLAAGPDTAALAREYRDLAVDAGMPPLAGADLAARSSLASLGLENDARQAVEQVLQRIAAGPAADAYFRSIFTRDGLWKLDLHDAMLWEAPHYLYRFQLTQAAEGLRALGELDPQVADSAPVRQAAWRLWSSIATDSAGVFARIDTLARRDEMSANALRAMLAGFDDATAWWRRAVSWLLTHPWLDTPAGPRSPAQLMAMFWGVDSLPLPVLEDARFGDAAALPVLSVAHVAPYLIRPLNASATEWLAHGGLVAAFAAWRPLRWGESPLTVMIGGRAETVGSPASQAIVHPAAFFGARDAIRIDPGIMPLAAVATFLHEWNHLLAEEHRLAGTHPAAVVPVSWQLQLREEDPWLSEGFAEWATDRALAAAGSSAAFLRFTQSEKRLGISVANPREPHILGYRLVRAVAAGRRGTPPLRDLLVQHLDDLGGFARAARLPTDPGGPAIVLQRPATAVVIPEVAFTWNNGDLLDWTRRLVIPNIGPEH